MTILCYFICTKGDYAITTTNVTTSMDENFKKQAEILASPFYSEENQRHLMKAISDLDNGKGKIHELIEVDDEK